MQYQGDYAEDATVYIMFNTFTSNDPSASSTITDFINTDVHIHKDDGLTQRNNAAGITVSVDFDGITGSHMIKIDTSNDTVGGFWVTGSDYFVRIEGGTVDGATGGINAVVGHFSIENRYNAIVDYDPPTKAEMDTGFAAVPTVTEIQAEMEENGASILDSIRDLLPGSTMAAATDIPAMVGTNNAALASVVGALTDGAADGDPTTAETLMQYIKQLINIMVGTAGVVAFPVEAAPGNGVSLAEVIRAIHADVTGLNGSAMIGTNSAALATVCTEARLVQLAEANLPTDIAAIPTVMVGTNNAATETKQDIMDTNIDQIETAVITNAAGTDIAADIIALKAVADAIQAITDALPNSGALTIDSVAFDAAMTQILSYVSGKIVKTSDAYEYKKRDNTTKAFTNTAAAAQRTRS
ncbi:hypothetical protein LCGC14_2015080 [marine sediment metagenome]|uniref:Uncharacterized protein n=1 Tax=marine sediment metagenome TaxID=412755 RepID=A0A0F9HCJ9_9ZZZZ